VDKVVASPAEAIADLQDGASVAVSGFGPWAGIPMSLLTALRERGSRGLTLVGNTVGTGSNDLIVNGQVAHAMVSFTTRAGLRSPAEDLIAAGRMTYEIIPQGTLVERMRAGGAGLAAVYTPTGVGTPIQEGKEVRYFDGKPYLLEPAIRVDYAFITGYRADPLGNVEFKGSNRHFAPSFAKAARIAIVEVDEIVGVGEIPPERIGLPGIFASRVVVKTHRPPFARPQRRPADVPRQYLGKPSWTRHEMAERAAALLPDRAYVNLGLGIPTLISNHLGGRDIVLHGENGLLGYGEVLGDDAMEAETFNAGGQFVASRPGISFFDSVTAFEMVRSGRVQVVALGAYQVDQDGSVANWSTPDMIGGGIGGAMDMVAGGGTVMILMEHRDSRDRAKLVKRCTYPLTGSRCVDIVVTDLAVLRRRRDGGFVLEDIAPGFTPEEVIGLTEMEPAISPALRR
jgi:3-oxoacid CoA-transferase